MVHVALYKKEIVKDLVNLINSYPVIGTLNVENLPAAQFQKMREQLRDKVVIRMTKRRFIKIALEQAKDGVKGVEGLEKHLVGMPALIFTKENPFFLGKILRKSRSRAPAKPGQIAPNDIVVNAGPTPFSPGPIIGELGSIGLKTSVEGGKVVIKNDKVVVREGERITANIADVLARLGIEPMEVGLDLNAAYENGLIYAKEILSVDEEEYLKNMRISTVEAFNLAVFSGYLTEDTVEFLVKRAFNEAKVLALSREMISDVVLEQMITKAERAISSLKETAKIPEMAKEKISEKEEVEKEKEEIAKKEKLTEKEEIAEKEIGEKLTEEEKIEIGEKPEEKISKKLEEKEELAKEKIAEVGPKLKEIKEAEKIEVKARVSEEEMRMAEEYVKKLQEGGLPSVSELVEKMKRFAKEGTGPSAEKILREVSEEAEEQKAEKEKFELPSLQELAEKAKKREMEKKAKEVPSAHDLTKRKKKLRNDK